MEVSFQFSIFPKILLSNWSKCMSLVLCLKSSPNIITRSCHRTNWGRKIIDVSNSEVFWRWFFFCKKWDTFWREIGSHLPYLCFLLSLSRCNKEIAKDSTNLCSVEHISMSVPKVAARGKWEVVSTSKIDFSNLNMNQCEQKTKNKKKFPQK